jgi:hypothetical protein
MVQPTQNVNDEGDITSQSVSLLPITAKDGAASLKQSNPTATGAQLKTLHKEHSLELKTYLTQLGTSLQANPQVGGVGVRYTKGRVSLVFKRFVSQTELVSDEDIAKRMGQSVAWVRKHMRKANTTIDADTGKELKPAPQNGTPELVPPAKPAKAPRKSKSAPVNVPATPAS